MYDNIKLEIINRVLLELGKDPVSDYTQQSGNNDAYKISLQVDPQIRIFLEMQNWLFNIKEANYMLPVSNDNKDYSYKYELPTDYIAYFRMTNSFDFLIVSNYIYTNVKYDDITKFYYHSYDIDLSKIKSVYLECIIYRIVSVIANTLTQNMSLNQMAMQKAKQLYSACIRLNNKDKSPSYYHVVNRPL